MNTEKRYKLIVTIILMLQTIVVVVIGMNSYNKSSEKECEKVKCEENTTTSEIKNEYKYLCSKEPKQKEGFEQMYYEEYTVDYTGLIISRKNSDKYIFSSKEEYDLQKDNFKPIEGREIKFDDEKWEVVIYMEENLTEQELWYRLIEKNLEERNYNCEEMKK